MNESTKKKPEFVYLLGAEGTNRIKVGRTKGAIDKRVAQLQTGNPFVIVERDHIETYYASKVESYLHALLANYRGQTGEWFEIPDELLTTALSQARQYAAHLDDTAARLKELAQAGVEEREELPTEDDSSLHLELLNLYSEKRRIAAEIEKREDALKLRVGTACNLGHLATWKLVETTRLNQDRLKTEKPELFDQYSAVSSSRRFVVNRNIED